MNAPSPEFLVCYIGEEEKLGRLLEQKLGELGFTVLVAVDPSSGVRVVQQNKPRVIIVDERVGRYDSLNVIATLRRLFPRPSVGIFWHASVITAPRVVQAHRAGADRILVWPLTIPSLVDRLNECLRPGAQVTLDREDEVKNRTAEETRGKLARVQNLSAVPYVVEKVLNITVDSDSSAKDLEKVIESDPKVSAVVLKRANSAFYSSTRKIGRILDAVARIGFREVRALVLGLSVIDLFPRESKTLAFDRVQFWISCLATAVVAQALAEISGDVDPDDAFVAGLLHDMGRIVLDENFPEDFARALSISERYHISLCEAETRVFGIDHQEIGREILERWSFPAHLVSIVAGHESLAASRSIKDPVLRKLAEVVWAGAWITRLLGIGRSGDRFVTYPRQEHVYDLKYLQAIDASFESLIRQRLDDLLEFIGADLPVPSRRKPGEAAATVLVYEESSLSISPLCHLLERAHFETRRLDSITSFASADRGMIAAAEFVSLESFRVSIPYLPAGRLPLLVLLPRGELPRDEKVKERAGFPVRGTVYIEKPFHENEFGLAIERLLALMDGEGTAGGPPATGKRAVER